MKKILILGQSVACAQAIEMIRQHDQESEITLLCFEEHLPYDRHLLPDLLAKEIPEEEVFYQSDRFYTQHKINILTGKELARIDFKRNRVIFETKDFVSYDILLIGDVPKQRLPDIKGYQKTGVFSFKTLSEIKTITGLLPIIETVCIQTTEISGLRIAESFVKRGKEVLLVVPQPHLLPNYFDKESGDFVAKILEEKGVRIFLNNGIQQILGEADTKAIRLSMNKVLACQMVILDQAKPDLRLFQDTPLQPQAGIPVDNSLKTSVSNVFAMDRVAVLKAYEGFGDYGLSTDLVKEQGVVVAANILGQENTLSSRRPVMSFRLFDNAIFLIGELTLGDEVRTEIRYLDTHKQYTKIFIKNDILSGAILINPTQILLEKIQRLIEEKKYIPGLEEQILKDDLDFAELSLRFPGAVMPERSASVNDSDVGDSGPISLDPPQSAN